MTRESWGGGRGRRAPSLRKGITDDLAALERTDPTVAAASRKYDETVASLNANMKAEHDAMAAVCAAAEAWRDDICGPRAAILLDAVDALRATRKARP